MKNKKKKKNLCMRRLLFVANETVFTWQLIPAAFQQITKPAQLR